MRMAILATLAALMPAMTMGQSATDGEAVFKKCRGCHQIGPDAKNRTGPVLTGVIGRTAGTYEGYRYSSYMKAAGAAGLVWTEDLIFEYLADPSAFLKARLGDPKARAKMTFRLKDAQDRRDVIAYLGTFQAAQAAPGGFCVENGSQHALVFAVETREGAREVRPLAPGEQLCAQETAAADGVVSVFETTEGFEGCSRIIPAGSIEVMLEYAEFDRCRWGSHQS